MRGQTVSSVSFREWGAAGPARGVCGRWEDSAPAVSLNLPEGSGGSPTAVCIRTWALLSNALRSQHGAPRAGDEAGLEQERHDLGLADRLAVEALDGQPLHAGRPDVLDKSGEGFSH